MTATFPPAGAPFIPIDELGARIQCAILDLMQRRGPGQLLRRVPDFDARCDPAFEGFCARACEAYVFLAEDPRTGPLGDPSVEARYVKHSEARGDSHYWLQNKAGIMDLNFGPDDDADPDYCDYEAGRYPSRTDGFRRWKPDERYPRNADARKIMDAVWRRLDADVTGVS